MKRITKDSKISIIQFALAIIAVAFYIAYSLLADPIFQDFSDVAEWCISRVIYAVPYILSLLSIIFGKYRNPRKSASHLLIALSFSFVPSFLDLIIYPPLILIENDFSFTMITIIMTFLISGGLLLSFWMPEIDEIAYSASCLFIVSIAFGYAITNVFSDDCVQSLNMLAFSFLLSSIAFYGLKFSAENKYTPKYYELFGLDDSEDMNFDYIVDAITDLYLTSELYANAIDARNFYYAIKYDDKEKLSKLNITGVENIKSVLELWLKFEDDFATSKEKTLFFSLCKHMLSEQTTDDDFENVFYLFCKTIKYSKNPFCSFDIDCGSKEISDILLTEYDAPFTFYGIKFASIESFLQGLKFKNPDKQAKFFAMSGKDARKAGRYHNWWKFTGNLYFCGEKFNRYSIMYDVLTDIPFRCRYDNENDKFKQALFDTEFRTLKCSNRKQEKCKTILTQNEYLEKLNEFKLKAFDEYYLENKEEE